MPLIIDGYNLLHASGVFGEERGPRGFEASRNRLLDHLLDLLGSEAARTTVVFDAARAPDGLPSRHDHGGITVLFAREYPDADTLIEKLLREHDTPTELTVVSSDRRLMAAARRRRCRAAESEAWLAEARAARRLRDRPPESKPSAPQSPEEIAAWLREFGLPPN
jgi:predicted RNA-binding protein with PIN domain